MSKAAIKKAQKLKVGELVAVLWLDSGRNSHTKNTKLATRWTYGRVAESEDEETLVLAMDVCTGQDEHDDAGNQWGQVWIPSVREIVILEPKKRRKRLKKRELGQLDDLAANLKKLGKPVLAKLINKAAEVCSS
jgi:hypothetical protein